MFEISKDGILSVGGHDYDLKEYGEVMYIHDPRLGGVRVNLRPYVGTGGGTPVDLPIRDADVAQRLQDAANAFWRVNGRG